MRTDINGTTCLCGLIGNPVEHTLSPIIHNTLSKELERNIVYVPFLVEKEGLEEAIRGAYQLNILGMNVTVPYKNQVMESLIEVQEEAAKIGAVNTLVRTRGGYKGYNTDADGLYRAMISDSIVIKDNTIIVLGAGGASKAVVYLCIREGAKKVYLLNRTLENAKKIADSVNDIFHTRRVTPMILEDYPRIIEDNCLCIQATSVGLYPNIDQAVIEDLTFYKKIKTGIDIIYKPAKTKFMELVEKSGGNTYNGLKMLLYQGISAYELWNGLKVDEKISLLVYEQLKKELGIGG